MKSLLELISQHSDANAIIPILAIISIVVTIIIYIVLKPKWIKYVVNGIITLIGAVVFINGYTKILDDKGLSLLIFGTKILSFGLIGLLFSAILDILDSLLKGFKKNKKNKKNKKEEKRTEKINSKDINNTNNINNTNTNKQNDTNKNEDIKQTKVIQSPTKKESFDETKRINLSEDNNEKSNKKEGLVSRVTKLINTKDIRDKDLEDYDNLKSVDDTKVIKFDESDTLNKDEVQYTKVIDREEIERRLKEDK